MLMYYVPSERVNEFDIITESGFGFKPCVMNEGYGIDPAILTNNDFSVLWEKIKELELKEMTVLIFNPLDL